MRKKKKKCKCEMIKQIHVHYHHEELKRKEYNKKFGQLIYSIEMKGRSQREIVLKHPINDFLIISTSPPNQFSFQFPLI